MLNNIEAKSDLIKALKKLQLASREFEFNIEDDLLHIHTFFDSPKTFTLKLVDVIDRPECAGLTANDYRKIIWDICDKYGGCEGCPHFDKYCEEHSVLTAPYYTLKAWAEQMQAKEATLPDMEVTGNLRKQLIAAGLPAGCKVIIGSKKINK